MFECTVGFYQYMESIELTSILCPAIPMCRVKYILYIGNFITTLL